MSQTIQISDEAYRSLERLASQQDKAPQELVEQLISLAASAGHRYYETDEWLRHLGFSDAEIAEMDTEIDAEEAADADA